LAGTTVGPRSHLLLRRFYASRGRRAQLNEFNNRRVVILGFVRLLEDDIRGGFLVSPLQTTTEGNGTGTRIFTGERQPNSEIKTGAKRLMDLAS
jgi:hypothetical protein